MRLEILPNLLHLESMHSDFDDHWTDKAFKREMIHDDYAKNAKNAVVTYTSLHIGGSY